MKHFLTLILTLLLITYCTENILASGFIVTGPAKDYYWHPSDKPVSYLKVFPDKFSPTMVSLQSEKTTVNIDGTHTATVNIEQTFYNPANDTLQVYYLFPLPQGVRPTEFTIMVDDGKNDSKYRADLWEADKAYYTFEDLVKRSNNPAFWQYAGQAMYKVGIYSCLPRTTYKIKVSYKQPLVLQNNTSYEFTHSLSTQSLNPSPLSNFEFNVNIKTTGKLTNLVCISHPLEAQQASPQEATYSIVSKKAKEDKDFTLFYSTGDQHIGYSLYTYKEPGKDGYYFLSFDAAYVTEADLVNKEVIFLLDLSDNMPPAQLAAVKKSVNSWIDMLRKGDRLNVVAYNTVTAAAFPEIVPLEGNAQKAKDYVNALSSGGKSNTEAALKYILAAKTQRVLPYYVVWVTAGGATAGNIDQDDLVDLIQIANLKTLRIYGFGFGETDVHLLDRMSWFTQGYTRYVLPNEDFDKKSTEFFSTINAPVLNNLQLYFSDGFETKESFPRKPENFFKGKKMTLAGRYKKAGEINVSLIGDVNEKMNRYNFKTPFPDNDTRYGFVPRLWAMRAMATKASELRKEEDEDLQDEIVELAQEHLISTPYTDYWVNEEQAYSKEFASTTFTAPDKHADLNQANGAAAMAASRTLYNLLTVDNPKQLELLQANPESVSTDNIVVQGKVMYKTSGGAWVSDKALQKRSSLKRIAFATKEYYDLVTSDRTFAEFLRLGRKIMFEKGGTGYEIYEDPELIPKPPKDEPKK
jgi:hypothetical protein